MSDFQFGHVSMLYGLWLLPLLAISMYYASRRRRQSIRRFVAASLLGRLGESSRPDPARRVLKSALVLGATGFLVVALARPAWDNIRQEVVQRGRDVVFLLDVSRSMLAEDLSPNRLERAKLSILDAVDRLEGDRVALAVFAGTTVVKCPLTLDYGFFRLALDDVSGMSVSRGGSLIGDGVRKVVRDVFDGKRSNYRDIVLITDGEDHESFPVEAAAEAGDAGIRLIVIGLGDERLGQRIPVASGGLGPAGAAERKFLQHEGQEVWSRLDAATLRQMADSTPGGRYLNVSTGAIDFGDVYRRLIASSEGREIGSRTIDAVEEKFQIFLAICVLLLALEMALRERPSARRATGGLLVALILPATVQAATVRGLVNEGNEQYRSEAFDRALTSYEKALERDPDSPYASLNKANALYRSGDYATAAQVYSEAVRQSLDRNLPELEAAGLHNLGNALFRQAEATAQSSPGQAIDLLVPAARSYLDALSTDARRADSAHNLEITRRLIQRLREQASQQPQSGDGGGRDNQDGQADQQQQSQGSGSADPDEALRQAAQEQEQLADESEQLARDRQEERGSDAREQQHQKAQELADRQQALSERTNQLKSESNQQSRQRIEDASRHQQQSQEQLDQNEPGDAAKSQRAAAQALRDAADGEQVPREPSSAQAESSPSDQAQAMTMEEILDKEKQDRRRRQILQRGGIVAVEKDW
ncbi:MAG: VWA domain-containing protein [Bryobacterales bacterium]|nr:VWA domain-containing protein [Bryobacterales bacterium]